MNRNIAAYESKKLLKKPNTKNASEMKNGIPGINFFLKSIKEYFMK
jgi:hypothetical protein